MNQIEPSKSTRRRRPRTSVLLGFILGTVCVIALLLTVAYVVADRLTEPGAPVVGVSAIAVKDNSFSPDSVQISPGTTVTWTWAGNSKHNIHGDGFDTPAQVVGTYSHTFDEPGTYDYECTLHFGMKGRVIVSESAAS